MNLLWDQGWDIDFVSEHGNEFFTVTVGGNHLQVGPVWCDQAEGTWCIDPDDLLITDQESGDIDHVSGVYSEEDLIQYLENNYL